ncbi:hypothetical protein GGI07_000188 [Coemansia sp. Benny D115]|nr:hypothetical protein GGI07_000188 [Coemansia sp. Benny D115]
MAAADTSTVAITYNLDSYKHLEAWKTQPSLYLDRYFVQRYYASPITNKRKLAETEAAPTEPTPTDTDVSADLVKQTRPREWQYVRMAPNKLCTIGIASNHPLLLDREVQGEDVGNITKVVFSDAIKNSVIKGKGKKQSLKLMPETKICTVSTDAGKEYTVRAAVRGVLMEWNSQLEQDPQLIVKNPTHAFFVIIKPPTDDDSKIFSECVSETS